MGAGSAVFVNSAADVTLDGMDLIGNQAFGGNGSATIWDRATEALVAVAVPATDLAEMEDSVAVAATVMAVVAMLVSAVVAAQVAPDATPITVRAARAASAAAMAHPMAAEAGRALVARCSSWAAARLASPTTA